MKVAILAEQNFNLIDGSTIWLLNTCKLMAMQPDLEVHLLLTHRLENPVLADELPDRVTVVGADSLLAAASRAGDRLTPEILCDVLAAWEDHSGRFDRFFVRGESYLTRLLAADATCDRVVAYAPGAIPELDADEPEWVTLSRAARATLVVQSETAKRAMESLLDYPASVVHVVPPVVFPADAPPRMSGGPVTLCYSGKIDLHYGLDWLIDICGDLADSPDFGVSLIAGKDTHRARYPEFFRDIDGFRAAVADGRMPGVSLVSNLAHADAKALMGQSDFAYCLRHDRYDDVIEISTKIVEFCALGVPPILNDNALNRTLFGGDYPYFVDIAGEDVPARLRDILNSHGTAEYETARTRIAKVADRFSAATLSDQLGRAVRGWPGSAPSSSSAARAQRAGRILIATHDGKFLRQFVDRLRGDRDLGVVWDHWHSTVRHQEQPCVPADVDTVFCEWCCENAVWHSRNKRPGTRLIIRLHRFEAFRDFPERVDWDNVDALIVVSGYFRDLMIERHGVAPERIHVLPQYIDWQELQRAKLPEARFTVGLVGINPFEHKRFDRAVDFFAALRARDSRFRLAVRSAMPWQIGWVWKREDEGGGDFERLFRRIFSDPDLAGAIRFDPAGPDMEEWYRGVGTILSSSDSEGCHTSVIEGMASGCLPVVHDWPGARSLFAPHVYGDLTQAMPEVIRFAEDPGMDAARRDIADGVRHYDVDAFVEMVLKLRG